LETNTKVVLKEQDVKVWIGLNWLRRWALMTNLYENGNEFHKRLRI